MAFPCSIVHGREILLVEDVGIHASFEQSLETVDVAFASSMHERRPAVKLINLIQICPILLQQEEQFRGLARPSDEMLWVEAFRVGENPGAMLEQQLYHRDRPVLAS